MDPILVDHRDGWSIVTLNRPDRLNAFNPEMHRALAAALDGIAKDEACRAVVLTGAGRGFSAGQDLAAVGKDTSIKDTLEELYNPLVRRIRSMPKPIIAAVNGVAAGAGANVALACDIVLAAKSAKFIQAFSKIALVPDSGGTWFLPRLVGEVRARALALTGEPVMAEQAAQWGMIWKAVDDAAIMSEAEALAAQLATMPTASLALIKQAFDASATNTLDQQLDLERDLQKEAAATPDFKEGVQAFMEKRQPRFHGPPLMSDASEHEDGPDPDDVARASADAMWAEDKASAGLGMELVDIGPGYATMAMTITEPMTNGHGMAHGGFVFLVADSAFAFACNSRGDKAVAQHCAVSFLRPGKLGDRLVANAHEVFQEGRAGIYDINVSVDGETIAEFRGHSRTIGGRWV